MKVRTFKKRGITVLSALILLFALAIPAFATSTTWYQNLPAYRNAVAVCNGTKSTLGVNAWASLTSMGGDFNEAYIFIQKGSTRVTEDNPAPIMREGAPALTLPYKIIPANGDTLTAYVGNNAYTYIQVSASGAVDFS